MSTPAIALYLGESYASLGVFDLAHNEIFQKSVFLPQVSFKNLLIQTKQNLSAFMNENEPVRFYIVTKYFDRLRNFRLGGSVTQVVCEGFENSYSAINTKSLSLAAASLVISVTPETLTENFLVEAIARIKKVNPDSNKVVIQLPPNKFSDELRSLTLKIFTAAEFKIFICEQPENLPELRKTLLNAGTAGTKEEIYSDIQEIFGDETEILFWSQNNFKKKFENHELFGSSSSFLAHEPTPEKTELTAYFDHECFRVISTEGQQTWQSPWGSIRTYSHAFKELLPHPFSEIRLDHHSMFSISQQVTQHEPGPVCAGRGIKPLVLDLFSEEISQMPLMKSLFNQFGSDSQKQKLDSHLSVIEKGQAHILLKTQRTEFKEHILHSLAHELISLSKQQSLRLRGPLAPLFGKGDDQFKWPQEIMRRVMKSNEC